jgi:PAS domain S-box-containing protein
MMTNSDAVTDQASLSPSRDEEPLRELRRLRRSEAQFTRIFQQSSICQTITNIETGEFYRVNDTWCRTFGYRQEETVGESTVTLGIWKATKDQRGGYLELLKREGKVHNFETKMQAKDGRILTVLISADLIDFEGEERSYSTITNITERAELERSFAIAFEANPEMVTVSHAVDGTIINANQRFLDYYRLTKDQVVGKNPQDLDLWRSKYTRPPFIDELEKHGKIRDFPVNTTNYDGETDHFLFSSDQVELDGVTAYLTIGRRVTEEVVAKQALVKSEERFRLLLEATPVPLVVVRDGIYIYTNRSADDLFGWPDGTLVGQHTLETFVDKIVRAQLLANLNDNGNVKYFEAHYRRRDGTTFWASITIAKVIYQDEPAYLTGMQDITEHRRLETAVRHSEARFQDFAEIDTDWLWEMDADLQYSYFSDRLTELIGMSPDRSLGKTRQQAVKADPNYKSWMRHEADLKAHRPFRDYRYTYPHDDGRILHWSVSGKPVFDDNGIFQGYRGTGTDITAEVEAQGQAANLQRASREFW